LQEGDQPYFVNQVLTFPRADNDLARDGVFAGHWERIVEMFFRKYTLIQEKDKPDSDQVKLAALRKSLRGVIDFVVKNPEVLAYQYLLSRLIIDFGHVLAIAWPQESCPERHLVVKILDHAARRVFRLNAYLAQPVLGQEYVQKRFQNSFQASFLATDRQTFRPITWQYKAVPKPVYMPDVSRASKNPALVWQDTLQRLVHNRTQPSALRKQWEETVGVKSHPGHPPDFLTDSIYLLLNSLQTALLEVPDAILPILTDDTVVSRLLVCAVWADPISMVAPQAFRILRQIFYPLWYNDEPDQNFLRTQRIDASPTVDVQQDRTTFARLIGQFAEEFVFSSLPFPQMVAAISIFWDHPYPSLPNDGPPVAEKVWTVTSVDGAAKPLTFRGQTPLEFYNHYLLHEPSWSDALNYQMLRILEMKEDEINVFRLAPIPENNARQVIEARKRIDSLDEFFVRFTRSKFKTRLPIALEEAHSNAEGRQEKMDQQSEVDMSFAVHLLGVDPTDEQLASGGCPPVAPLNGYVYRFLRFLQSSRMFQYGDDDTSPLEDYGIGSLMSKVGDWPQILGKLAHLVEGFRVDFDDGVDSQVKVQLVNTPRRSTSPPIDEVPVTSLPEAGPPAP
jgi:hypothetical protein